MTFVKFSIWQILGFCTRLLVHENLFVVFSDIFEIEFFFVILPPSVLTAPMLHFYSLGNQIHFILQDSA